MMQPKHFWSKFNKLFATAQMAQQISKITGRKLWKNYCRGFVSKIGQSSNSKAVNNPNQNVQKWINDIRRYSNPSTNFNENSEKSYTPLNPLTFENNKWLLYQQNTQRLGQTALALGSLLADSLFIYMTFRSLIGPSGIIMKLIKTVFSSAPLLLLAPFSLEWYKSLTSTITAIHLEENGEYVVVSHSYHSKRFKIKDFKIFDKETYWYTQEGRSEVTDRYVPVHVKEYMFYLDRQGVYFHKDIVSAILHSNIIKNDNTNVESVKVYSKINTSGYENSRVKDVEVTEISN